MRAGQAFIDPDGFFPRQQLKAGRDRGEIPKQFHPLSVILPGSRRQKKAPRRGAFSGEDRLSYLLMPEPGPVGVSVDPLGEEPAPMVLPDGFVVVVEPGAVERDAPEPVVVPAVPIPVPVPLTDEPVPAPPAAPPEAEPAPPAPPPPLCASAKVLVSARAVASAIVEIFMVASFLRCP
jgi:hypothetical protein